MDRYQKRTLYLLLILSGVLFVLLAFPNHAGARDANMLSIFEVDEYGQYPHVLGMLIPGDSLYQTLRNFFVYLHYFYGYPFYFFSALVLLPVRLILGAGWQAHTALIVMVLRQGINVLPMLAALLLLVWMQTRFRPRWLAVGLFVLLASVPAVLSNDMWWHPDSLAFLFVALTLFFLQRDNLRFGPNFFLAAAASGLALGTKHLGEFFVAAIPIYLLWGVLAHKIEWKHLFGLGAAYVAVMLAAVVISNPLLLLPQERAEIIATQKLQFEQTSQGFYLVTGKTPFDLSLSTDFRANYGSPLFVLLALCGLVAGIARPHRRLLNGMVLAWFLPIAVYFGFFAIRRIHYFIPIMLPVYSSMVWLFPQDGPERFWRAGLRAGQRLRAALPWMLGVVVLVQFGLFLRTDAGFYWTNLRREHTSPSIAFFDAVEQQVLPQLGTSKPVIYRDWQVYVPQEPGWRVELNWDLASYDYIRQLKPDLILLEQANVKMFSRPDALQNAVNTDRMAATHAFYLDVKEDKVPGYRVVYEDGFGLALGRE